MAPWLLSCLLTKVADLNLARPRSEPVTSLPSRVRNQCGNVCTLGGPGGREQAPQRHWPGQSGDAYQPCEGLRKRAAHSRSLPAPVLGRVLQSFPCPPRAWALLRGRPRGHADGDTAARTEPPRSAPDSSHMALPRGGDGNVTRASG